MFSAVWGVQLVSILHICTYIHMHIPTITPPWLIKHPEQLRGEVWETLGDAHTHSHTGTHTHPPTHPHPYTHTYLRTQHNTRITHCTHNKHTQFLQHSPHIYTHKCHTHPSLSSTYYSYSTTYHTPHLQYLHKITGTDNSHNSSSSHFTYPPNLHTRFTFIILRPEYNSHLKTITQLTAPLTST